MRERRRLRPSRSFATRSNARAALSQCLGITSGKTRQVGSSLGNFTGRDGSPLLTAAGLWDEWKDRQTGERLKSCTMIITEPNDFAAEIHDRMPVLLREEQFAPWLRRGGRCRVSEACSERLSATLASIEAGQQLKGRRGRCDVDRAGRVGDRVECVRAKRRRRLARFYGARPDGSTALNCPCICSSAPRSSTMTERRAR
jgi:hypothetical protein